MPLPSQNRDPGLPDPAENARQLARDMMRNGTAFTDVLGRRIDPATIRPSGSDRSAEEGRR